MSTLEEIKSAIGKLSLEERAIILSELANWEDDDWDRQMKADAAAGKFEAMNEAALKAHQKGKTIALDKILDEA